MTESIQSTLFDCCTLYDASFGADIDHLHNESSLEVFLHVLHDVTTLG